MTAYTICFLFSISRFVDDNEFASKTAEPQSPQSYPENWLDCG